MTSNAAVRFTCLEFEKTDFERDKSKKRKRPVVTGNRDGYCATPIFSRQVTREEIKNLSDAFDQGGKCNSFVETLKGNNFQPVSMFDTSCNYEYPAATNVDASESRWTRIDLFHRFSPIMETSSGKKTQMT